ncbi:cytochrome C6 [Alkalihalobacillus alcalophilus ATCC 27647 = CGMCC 1.3604]|uniref:Cytochrome C6 n=1 Tax=Alkalihalobacillus alcalophilus ATCC 27647 = CGMCC 1.3604 TaxID=1218173 RepID=J8TSY6_ALKAL|nr:D-allose ABC transporter permease [Alkalihalobacillus alcalophilus]AFV25729.1 sugar transporter [Alkalihalobacillus alcalophilus ATCC 27647 = CGMCC 1.3604]KGA98655.1 D-allose transporter subunit [Alkalihalobacillus alcalophilus ATCC 27647 = CGMCC 1.3604]MED1562433.1 D-allose ABC transporter permease [Alkalihalobacillus alcalophilus]THG91169.1 cytochrome C6 [Alkalihalobacillus alcalophilus ATCC 27647 = CGMCC 1.3604]
MKSNQFNSLWQKYGTFGILVLIIFILGIISPQYFFTGSNLTQVILQSSINIIVGVGEFFPILIAGIDLSVGSIMALTGMITAKLLVAGVPVVLSVLIGGLVVGALLGFINGYLVVKTNLHPFIITLGTLSIFRGLTLIISDARPVYGLPIEFTQGIAGYIWFIPIPVIIALSLAIVLIFVTNKTKLGRNIYAIGGNTQAAWFSGINVKLYTIVVFMISGVCAGIAGVVLTARLGAAEPLAGTGFELFAIAAAIIGGTSFFGGKGRIIGVVMGALIIGVINNGLNILNVPTYYQQIVMGSLIIGAVALDRFFANKKS